MSVLFRPHDPDDYAAIAGLRWLLKSEDTGAIPGCDREAFAETYLRHLASVDAAGDTVHWLAEADDGPVAVMTLRTVHKEPAPGKEGGCFGYLTNCYVLPAHRNRGVGTRLLDHIARCAAAKGMELLIVWPSERSCRFYRRAGFAGSEAPLELMLDAGS